MIFEYVQKYKERGEESSQKTKYTKLFILIIRTVYLKNKLLMNLYMLTFILCSKMATVKIYLYKNIRFDHC